MIEFLPELITVAILHLLAVAAPGPDFVLITRNSFIYSRRIGIYSAVGVALGILVHVIYSLVGLGLIISKSILLFSTIKFLGAGYLIYIGIKALTSKKPTVTLENEQQEQKNMSSVQAVRMGFLTNALNPKATLFFLALFTQVISLNTPLMVKVVYGIEMLIATFLWFALVSFIVSHDRIKKPFSKIQHYVEKTMGALLIALGIKVALSSNK